MQEFIKWFILGFILKIISASMKETDVKTATILYLLAILAQIIGWVQLILFAFK